MKKYQAIFLLVLFASIIMPAVGFAQEVTVLDDFEYDDPAEIFDLYSNSGWKGTGEAYISDDY